MANISLPLGIDSLEITAQTLDKQGNIILDVKSKRTEIPCRKCGKLINKKRGFGDVLKVRLDCPRKVGHTIMNLCSTNEGYKHDTQNKNIH